jgi:hypothetical protein
VSNNTTGSTSLRNSPDYRVVYWQDNTGKVRSEAYDLRKGQYTNDVDAWVRKHAGNAYVTNVTLANERGYTDQEKLLSAIKNERTRIKSRGFLTKKWIELPPVQLDTPKRPTERYKPEMSSATPDLNGTTWKESDGELTHFNSDGTWYSISTTGTRRQSEGFAEFSWKQSGQTLAVRMVTHDPAREYGGIATGTISGDTITLSWQNFGYSSSQSSSILKRVPASP